MASASQKEEQTGAPGGIRTPDTQFRSLVVQGVAPCSPLFVNSRLRPESGTFPLWLTDGEQSRMLANTTFCGQIVVNRTGCRYVFRAG